MGKREPESEFAERGSHFHALAKLYVDFLVASKQPVDWSYGEELCEGRQWGAEATTIFLDWLRNKTFDYESIWATEYKVRLDSDFRPITDDGPVMWSADFDRLDIIGTEAIIPDYKTNWMVFEPTTIQSIYYPWLLFKLMPHLTKVTFNLQFVRYNTERSREFTQADLPKMDRYVMSHVMRLVDAVETDQWPAAVNSGCAYCRLECPLVTNGLTRQAIGQVGSTVDASRLAQELYALRMSYQRTHALLKAYASEHGPIDAGNDIQLGFSKRTKYEYDPKAVAKLNLEHGFHELRGMTVSSQEIKKIGKHYQEYMASAKATAKDRSTTSFQFWNETGDPMAADDDDSDGVL